jgi:hypothetical protein
VSSSWRRSSNMPPCKTLRTLDCRVIAHRSEANVPKWDLPWPLGLLLVLFLGLLLKLLDLLYLMVLHFCLSFPVALQRSLLRLLLSLIGFVLALRHIGLFRHGLVFFRRGLLRPGVIPRCGLQLPRADPTALSGSGWPTFSSASQPASSANSILPCFSSESCGLA